MIPQKITLEIPYLESTILIPPEVEEYELNRKVLQRINKNFLISPFALEKISEKRHFLLKKDSSGKIYILDPDSMGLSYLNGIIITSKPTELYDGVKIQVPLQTTTHIESLELIVHIEQINTQQSQTLLPNKLENTSMQSQANTVMQNSLNTSQKTIFLRHEDIQQRAYKIYEQHHSYDEYIWALAEANIMLDNAFIAKDRPGVTQRITGPIVLKSGLVIKKPLEEEIRTMAQKIYEEFHPSMEELHWLIAERKLIYDRLQ